jgi:pentatricopeptide repeat protein
MSPDVISYNLVISSLALSGKLQEALSMLTSMHRTGIQPTLSTYIDVMRVADQRGEYGIILQVWGHMRWARVEADIGSTLAFVQAAARVGWKGSLPRHTEPLKNRFSRLFILFHDELELDAEVISYRWRALEECHCTQARHDHVRLRTTCMYIYISSYPLLTLWIKV